MRITAIILLLFWVAVSAVQAQPRFQLAPPMVHYSSVFYDTAVTVRLEFRQPGSEIRYTTGKEDIDKTSPLYTAPLRFRGGIIQFAACSMAKGYLPSEKVKLVFMPAGLPLKKIEATPPHAKYPGKGVASLNDMQGGVAAASSSNWLGYTADTVQITAELEKPQRVKQVMLQFLVNEGSWIFLPEQIRVEMWDEERQQFRLVLNRTYAHDNTRNAPGCYPEFLQNDESWVTRRVRLTVISVKQIPQWHEAKGEHAWVFIDELKLY